MASSPPLVHSSFMLQPSHPLNPECSIQDFSPLSCTEAVHIALLRKIQSIPWFSAVSLETQSPLSTKQKRQCNHNNNCQEATEEPQRNIKTRFMLPSSPQRREGSTAIASHTEYSEAPAEQSSRERLSSFLEARSTDQCFSAQDACYFGVKDSARVFSIILLPPRTQMSHVIPAIETVPTGTAEVCLMNLQRQSEERPHGKGRFCNTWQDTVRILIGLRTSS